MKRKDSYTAQFKKFGKTSYAAKLYPTVATLASLWWRGGSKMAEVCSGPGALAEYYRDSGFNVAVCIDQNEEFVNACESAGFRSIMADVISDVLPRLPANVSFVNASGYFSNRELESALGNIIASGGRRILANFFVKEDQNPLLLGYPILIDQSGASYTFDMGFESLVLRAIPARTLDGIFDRCGLRIVGEVHYADFKAERIYLLEYAK